MATAVTSNQHNQHEESVLDTQAGRDASAEIADKEQVLQMVNTGFDEERVFDSEPYMFAMEMLEDPKLKDEAMYEKLVIRLSAFFLNNEKIREDGGLKPSQLEVIRKSGFSQAYRVKLHKCLRELLIHIVNERNVAVKKR